MCRFYEFYGGILDQNVSLTFVVILFILYDRLYTFLHVCLPLNVYIQRTPINGCFHFSPITPGHIVEMCGMFAEIDPPDEVREYFSAKKLVRIRHYPVQEGANKV